ncbi:MAG TPA: hypothetical protein VFQ55_06975 [Casimicrobiaceae bacterium]|nr:hypothetical protein [Casimicrobiaceae bacterium]
MPESWGESPRSTGSTPHRGAGIKRPPRLTGATAAFDLMLTGKPTDATQSTRPEQKAGPTSIDGRRARPSPWQERR